MYSVAVLRFVNAIADNAQKSKFAQSVEKLFTGLGWPSWIVDLRHGATHDDLPSLATLRIAAVQLLGLLQERYWDPQAELVAELEQGELPGRVDGTRGRDEVMANFRLGVEGAVRTRSAAGTGGGMAEGGEQERSGGGNGTRGRGARGKKRGAAVSREGGAGEKRLKGEDGVVVGQAGDGPDGADAKRESEQSQENEEVSDLVLGAAQLMSTSSALSRVWKLTLGKNVVRTDPALALAMADFVVGKILSRDPTSHLVATVVDMLETGPDLFPIAICRALILGRDRSRERGGPEETTTTHNIKGRHSSSEHQTPFSGGEDVLKEAKRRRKNAHSVLGLLIAQDITALKTEALFQSITDKNDFVISPTEDEENTPSAAGGEKITPSEPAELRSSSTPAAKGSRIDRHQLEQRSRWLAALLELSVDLRGAFPPLLSILADAGCLSQDRVKALVSLFLGKTISQTFRRQNPLYAKQRFQFAKGLLARRENAQEGEITTGRVSVGGENNNGSGGTYADEYFLWLPVGCTFDVVNRTIGEGWVKEPRDHSQKFFAEKEEISSAPPAAETPAETAESAVDGRAGENREEELVAGSGTSSEPGSCEIAPETVTEGGVAPKTEGETGGGETEGGRFLSLEAMLRGLTSAPFENFSQAVRGSGTAIDGEREAQIAA